MPGSGFTHEPDSLLQRASVAWLAVAAWASLIWWLGSAAFGAASTSRFLFPLITWLWPDASFEQRFAVLLAIRKLAHPTVYGVLAALACRALRLSGVAKPLQAMAIAWALAVSLAGLDEIRQSTLASRTGSPFDVGLDACGAAAAVVLYNGTRSARGSRRSSR